MESQNAAGSYFFDITKADMPETEIPIKINS